MEAATRICYRRDDNLQQRNNTTDVKSPNESEYHVMWFDDNVINMRDDNDHHIKVVEKFLL
jgi:hypothetical protein